MTQAMNPSARYLAQLRQNLAKHFNKDELRTLCFDLGIEHENLPETIDGMARELVAYYKRMGRVPELVRKCKELRPKVAWEDSPATPPQAPSPPSATILIIDDEADWRRVCKDALRSEGYRIELAATQSEAFDKLGEISFDLVITNLLLRDSFTSGWLAESTLILDQIAEQERTQVIIFTGTNDKDSEIIYKLLNLQRDYRQVREILFKSRCTTPELRRTVRQVLMSPP